MKVNNKEYITMSEMVGKSGKTANTIKQWLFNHNIKPISREALYEPSVLDALLAAPPPGKPKKQSKNKTVKKK
jgi:hypothetical protein